MMELRREFSSEPDAPVQVASERQCKTSARSKIVFQNYSTIPNRKSEDVVGELPHIEVSPGKLYLRELVLTCFLRQQ